jgi:single-strand DNA-binding protein
MGNLTRDVEIRYSQGGLAIAKTGIASSRKFTTNGEKKEEICFVDLTFFGRSGEVANQYLRKGSKVMIEGRLSFEQWTDDKGQKHSKHSVIVETMQMIDSRSTNTSVDSEKPEAFKPVIQNQTATQVSSENDNPFDDGIREEDIPF